MSKRSPLLALTALSASVLLHDDAWISRAAQRAQRYPADLSWDEPGRRSRAFRCEIRYDLRSSVINDTKNCYEHNFKIGRRLDREPARFWRDASHRERHLGLAARPRERAQGSQTCNRTGCRFDRHSRCVRAGHERIAHSGSPSSLSERTRYRDKRRSHTAGTWPVGSKLPT